MVLNTMYESLCSGLGRRRMTAEDVEYIKMSINGFREFKSQTHSYWQPSTRREEFCGILVLCQVDQKEPFKIVLKNGEIL